MDVIIMTALKYQSKVSRVIYSLERVSNKIIDTRFDNMLEIIKSKGHGSLEGFSNVFKVERYFPV
jgi:hypothetical protein